MIEFNLRSAGVLLALCLASIGCDDDTPKCDATCTPDAGGEGEGEGEGEGAAPLSNGPGGSLVMSASCAPDDGAAWQLVVGLGSACDMGAPDPSVPWVRITVYHPELFEAPVDTEASWTDWQHGQATFYPSGSGGPASNSSAGSLYLSRWDGIDTGNPPEGGEVAGWYTLVLEDGTEIGAAFSGVWCGGEPMCG